MSDSSFGSGLALQDKVPNQVRDFILEQGTAGRAKKQDKDDAAYRKYVGDIKIDPKQFHPSVWGKAREVYNDFLTSAADDRQNNPDTYLNELPIHKAQAQQKIAELQSYSRLLGNQVQAVDQASQHGLMVTPEMEDFVKKVTTADPRSLDNFEDPFGNVTFSQDPQTGLNIPHVLPIPKIDFGKRLRGDLNDPNYQTYMGLLAQNTDKFGDIISQYGYSIPKTEADRQQIQQKMVEKGFPSNVVPTSAEALIKNIATDQMYFKAAEQEVRDQLLKTPGYFSDSPEDKKRIVADYMRDRYMPYAGNRTKQIVARAPRPTEAQKSRNQLGWDANALLSSGGVAEDQTRNYQSENDQIEAQKVPFTYTLPKKGSTVVASSTDMYDANTGKPIREAGKQYLYSGGEFMTKYVGGKYQPYISSQVIDKDEIEKNPALTTLFKEFGTAQMKNPNLTIEDYAASQGFQIDKKYIRNIEIPLDKLSGFLQSREAGYQPVKAMNELATIANKNENAGAEKENAEPKLSSRQNMALDAFEKQFKRKPSQTEYQKILVKYK